MKLRKLKKFAQNKWRPRFSNIVQKVFQKYAHRIAENVMQNNALFRRLTSIKD